MFKSLKKDYDFYKELKKTKTNINKRIKVFEKQIEEIKKGNLPEFPPNIDPDIDRPGDDVFVQFPIPLTENQ